MSINEVLFRLKPKMSIKSKLRVSAAITIVLALGVALTVTLQYKNVGQAVRTERFAHAVIKDISDLDSLGYAYLLLKDKRPKVQWQLKHASIGKVLWENIEATSDEQALIARLRADHERLKNIFDALAGYAEEGRAGAKGAPSAYDELNEGLTAQLLARSEAMMNDSWQLGRESARHMDEVRRISFILVLISASLLIISATFTASLLAKSIGRSLRKLEQGTQRIAAGDLRYRVDVGGSDEISVLAAAFNDMTAKLQTSYLSLEREIGERKHAEEAFKELNQLLEQRIAERTNELAASEQRWATTLASIGDAVIATDTAGRVIFLNSVAVGLTGWQSEEATRQPIQSVFRVINEKTLELREDIAQRVLQEGSIITLANNTALITRSGQTIPIEDSAAPIKDREGKINGVVLVFHDVSEKRRTQEALQQRTLELEHLTETLEERVKGRTEELADLSSRLVSAQEDERRRVSYDLHDNAWQALVAIRFEMEHLFSGQEGMDWAALQKRSKKIMTDLLEAVGKIRSMQGDLWPYVLDDIGILATIDWYCREFEKNHPGLAIEKQDGLSENDIPPSAKIVIYRILQETLNNVAKHSQASRVIMGLRKNDHRMEFIVEDNGLGFDPEEVMVKRSPWGGLGLLNLKARTELSGGRFGVESAMGKGTIVRASWSLPEGD